MTKLVEKFGYRSEIDGLRAIAVLTVVLYHAGLGVGGGYIGVDVFFVISGFLITSLILKDLQEGKFTFSGFWERRARRIVPALVVVGAATMAAGWFLLLPTQFADLGKSAVYLTLFIANFYFYLGTGYFAGASEEKPLLHTWSLAVEEQFYIFVPVILYGFFRFPLLRKRSFLFVIFAAGIFISLAVSIYWVTSHPAANFYLLPTRAWELLMGSVVALAPVASVPTARKWRELIAWTGLACILFPCWLYTKNTPFPGLAAVPPCLGAALFIWATTRTSDNGQTLAARLLSTRIIVSIGLISYSLYLWHWPLIAYSNYWALRPLSDLYRIGIVAVSIFLAYLSWRFIETPFRTRRFCSSRKGVFAFAACSFAVLFCVGALTSAFKGVPLRLPSALKNAFAENAQDDLLFVHNLEAGDVAGGRLVPFGNPNPTQAVELLVWGDSHAMAAMPAFDVLFKQAGLAGRAATYSSRAPLLDWYKEDSTKSARFNEAVLSYIAKERIPNVILVGCWTGYESIGLSAVLPTPLQRSIEKTVKEVVLAGCRPWILTMVPNHPYDVPKAMVLANFLEKDESTYCGKPSAWNGLAGADRDFFKRLEAAGARLIDARPAFYDSTNNCYIMSLNGASLYRDRHHLSKRGAEKMLLPVLEAHLKFENGAIQ